MKQHLGLVGFLLLIVVAVAGCGDGAGGDDTSRTRTPADDVRDAVSRYYQAYNDQDWETWRTTLSDCLFEENAQLGITEEDVLARARGVRESGGKAEVVEIADVVIDGQTASAAVTTKTEEGETSTQVTRLRLENGAWLFDGSAGASCGVTNDEPG